MATFKFDARSLWTDALMTDLSGPVCTVLVARQGSLDDLDRTQRQALAALIKEVLLNIHVLPEIICKGRRVEAVTFSPSAMNHLGLTEL